jgi:hypothetical protein
MTSSVEEAFETSVIPETGWRPVGSLDPRSLGKARWLALNLVQWPARIANSYVTGVTWRDRMRLQWRADDDSFVTQSFERGLGLKLKLPTLEMCFLEQGRPVPHTFDPEGRSPAEAEAWILVELLHRGIDQARFATTLPYNVPDLMMGDAEDYSLYGCAAELAELTAWYHNAALSFADLAHEVGTLVRPLECSSENLTMTCRLKSGRGRVRASEVELSFSPGLETGEEPHLWARPVKADEGPYGAPSVLDASAIAATAAPQASALAFLRKSVSDFRR